MSASGGDRAPGVRPPVATAFATIAFATLVIFGFGMLSLALSQDVISVPGLGQLPGIVSLLVTTVSFGGALLLVLRRPGASYGTVPAIAAATLLVYVATLWIAAVASGADLAAATAAVGGLVTSWFGVVVAAAAAVSAWGGIALVRTRADRPRWPWEDEDDQ